MNKMASGTNLLLLKAICIAMCLVFGASLFATGVFADAECKVKCCCQSTPMDQHHNPGKQIRSAMGCCTGSPLIPCDIESGRSFDLPNVILCSVCSDGANFLGPTGNLSGVLNNWFDFSGNHHHRYAGEKIHSPPLYLQNLIFLI
jgi:hypothetical protein